MGVVLWLQFFRPVSSLSTKQDQNLQDFQAFYTKLGQSERQVRDGAVGGAGLRILLGWCFCSWVWAGNCGVGARGLQGCRCKVYE